MKGQTVKEVSSTIALLLGFIFVFLGAIGFSNSIQTGTNSVIPISELIIGIILVTVVGKFMR